MPKRICSIDGCDNSVRARSYCTKHYQRWKSHGDPLKLSGRRTRKFCTIEGCDGPVIGWGWCSKHYRRWRKLGDPLAPPIKRAPKPRAVEVAECKFDGCSLPHYGKGYCNGHWQQVFKRGELPRPLIDFKAPVEDRFWSRVKKTDGCWEWTGGLTSAGYGLLSLGNGNGRVLVHRFSYEMFVGEIPEGKHLDHICFNPTCVNPKHLRVTSNKENSEHRKGAYKNSKTGIRGVYWNSHRSGYMASVTHHGEKFYWGPFSTAAEADEVAREQRARIFTHDDAVY